MSIDVRAEFEHLVWSVESWLEFHRRLEIEQADLDSAAPADRWPGEQRVREVLSAREKTGRAIIDQAEWLERHYVAGYDAAWPLRKLCEYLRGDDDGAERLADTWASLRPRIGGLAGMATTNDEPSDPAEVAVAQLSAMAHTPDFTSVKWGSEDFTFTGNQAAIVKQLWEAREQGTPDVHGSHLLETAGISSDRVDTVFRDSPAWKTMIVGYLQSGRPKGAYRLVDPADAAASQPPSRKRRKNSSRA
jgi:hypothetical protein